MCRVKPLLALHIKLLPLKMKINILKLTPLLLLISTNLSANEYTNLIQTVKRHPFYVGVLGGFGSTNWNGLVDIKAYTDGSYSSVPIKAYNSGFDWGLIGGVDITPYFGLETQFHHYQTTKLFFAEGNVYFNDYGAHTLYTHTSSVALMAKVMAPIFNTGMRFYSEVGPAVTHREDHITSTSHGAASFGAGINYNLNPWVMVQLGFNYTTGFGKSTNVPVDDYIPFLYSVDLALVGRFGL